MKTLIGNRGLVLPWSGFILVTLFLSVETLAAKADLTFKRQEI